MLLDLLAVVSILAGHRAGHRKGYVRVMFIGWWYRSRKPSVVLIRNDEFIHEDNICRWFWIELDGFLFDDDGWLDKN
ncbi:hypothetical protein CEXT_410991 [Caerostris extrusa]|uniref:Secreted protein n=1 Tax=Caerostris extrusa TaxID=172846 RepID=A0AAV4SQG0_CAEEX|nr:hypothetical protein CEXT_410991 [Caerostris extrusa]